MDTVPTFEHLVQPLQLDRAWRLRVWRVRVSAAISRAGSLLSGGLCALATIWGAAPRVVEENEL